MVLSRAPVARRGVLPARAVRRGGRDVSPGSEDQSRKSPLPLRSNRKPSQAREGGRAGPRRRIQAVVGKQPAAALRESLSPRTRLPLLPALSPEGRGEK